MIANKTEENKRKHIRYDIDLGSFAVFRRDPMILPGLIVDISEGGLAFFYHEEEEWPTDRGERFNLFGDQYHVENVPLVAVYDARVTDTTHPIYTILAGQKNGPIKIRRRGVTFGTLTSDQKKGINAIIEAYHRGRQEIESQK